MTAVREWGSRAYHAALPETTFAEGVLAKEIKAGWRVLDVGCGTGAKLTGAALPAGVSLFGVDGHQPSLDIALANGYSGATCSDLMEFLVASPDAAFDCLVSLDVVEHFTRSDGDELLRQMCRVARRRVIVLTPTGFVPQPPAPDNPHQEHLSGWWPEDFAQRGFDRCYGINGWRPLRGEYAAPTLRPRGLGLAASELTQLFVRTRPEHAYQFIAVRDIV